MASNIKLIKEKLMYIDHKLYYGPPKAIATKTSLMEIGKKKYDAYFRKL